MLYIYILILREGLRFVKNFLVFMLRHGKRGQGGTGGVDMFVILDG
jgi:hypothetical protein